MTIKQLGGVFGRNPTFNDVTIEGITFRVLILYKCYSIQKLFQCFNVLNT